MDPGTLTGTLPSLTPPPSFEKSIAVAAATTAPTYSDFAGLPPLPPLHPPESNRARKTLPDVPIILVGPRQNAWRTYLGHGALTARSNTIGEINEDRSQIA